ncbi:sulfatase-like hydrolase/transferase [Qipengyuania nanhaisediminis]|uniref:sulfatase-like hydrolase/transferase n=1 Tax=Qipengyuania nanhaisediminis TaxID=604088 RepID=UPI0038B35BF3
MVQRQADTATDRHRPAHARAGLVKPVLIALWAALVLPGPVAERVAGLGASASLIAYFVLLGWTLLGIIAAAYIPSRPVRLGAALVFAGGAFVASASEAITGGFMTYDVFVTLLMSAGFAGEAAAQFAGRMAGPAALSLLLAVAIGLAPAGRAKDRVQRLAPVVTALPVLALLSVTALLFARGGDGARGIAPSYPTIAYLALFAAETVAAPGGPREEPALPRNGPAKARHVVLIVDESIAPAHLDVTSATGIATPLTSLPADIAMANFGIVPSITNCSMGTNLALRFGGRRDNYRETIASGPSIWAYARKAGMRTVYIDAQRTGGALHNAMGEDELALIDAHIQFDDVAVVDRDMAAADALARALSSTEPSFVLVNKVGAHFPVHDKFPDAFMVETPVLERGRYGAISDTGLRDGFDGTAQSWQRYRNSYRNTLRWNVGRFFEALLDKAKLDDAVLIYTSDHGQDLHANGAAGLATHCTPEPRAVEGAVPLVVLSGGVELAIPHEALSEGSHYRIFPWVLALMGYDRAAVRHRYGPALDSTEPDPRTFNARFNARLGRQPVWLPIDEAEASTTIAAR